MRLIACAAVLMAALTMSGCGGNDSAPSGVDDISALQKIDTVVGTGTEATTGRTVTVHYTLWLYSAAAADHKGTRMQSSRDTGQPFSFTLGTGQVIAGWDQGVPGMRVGGMRTLYVPSSLGYGSAGRAPIPGGSALTFDIELLNVQ